MGQIFRKLLLKLTQTKYYVFIVEKIIPYIRFTTYYPSFTGKKYRIAHQIIKKGDIILCADNKKLTTMLIGGEFTHAAICIGKDDYTVDFYETVEMTHEGCKKDHLFDLCKESDRIAILRCRDWDFDYIKRVIDAVMTFQRNGVKYDYEFSLGIKALYCSELIYQADLEKRLQVSLEDLSSLGVPYISPTGLLNAKNCELVFDSDNVK